MSDARYEELKRAYDSLATAFETLQRNYKAIGGAVTSNHLGYLLLKNRLMAARLDVFDLNEIEKEIRKCGYVRNDAWDSEVAGQSLN